MRVKMPEGWQKEGGFRGRAADAKAVPMTTGK